MSNVAETKFTIRAVNKTEAAFSKIQNSINGLERKCGRLGSVLSSRLAPAFAAVFAGDKIIETITKFERLEASLRTVTGSAEKAAGAFKHIQEFAAKTPFQLDEVTGAFIKLKALGLTPSEAALKSYGNTAIAMGKSLNQMIEAVADATTGEFERLKEFGIKARTQGEQVTFTFQGISKTVGKNAAEIESYLRSIGEVQFAGAIEEKANTLVTAIAKMKDAFAKLVKAIGDSGLTEMLIGIANGISWLVETITNSIEPIQLAHLSLTAEIMKFGNMFIAVLKGVGKAFIAFVENISNKFSALGKDLAAFIENPLSGVSFDNTKKALEIGLVDSMKGAFDQAIEEAKSFNQRLDYELNKYKDSKSNKDKSTGSLEEMFGGASKSSGTVSNGSKISAGRSKTGTMEDSYNNLVKEAKFTSEEIENDFSKLGKLIEKSFVDSLSSSSIEFESFRDIAKNVFTEIGQSLLKMMSQGGGSNVFGGFLSSMSSGFGNIFSGASSLFGGFFADGGTLAPGKFGIVGENGPELAFAGNSSLNIMPEVSSGGNFTINMNVQTPDTVAFRQSGSQIAADIARQIERARRNL